MPKINDIKIAPISTLTGDEILYTVKDDQDRNFTTETLKEFIGDGAKGADGTNGLDGIDGKSAYELAVINGYVGTEAEWLESLKGADGAKGEDGTSGSDGAKGADGTNGLDGIDGINGINGVDGKSAYEVALTNGYVGTEAEWLESLKGADGSGDSGGSATHQVIEYDPADNLVQSITPLEFVSDSPNAAIVDGVFTITGDTGTLPAVPYPFAVVESQMPTEGTISLAAFNSAALLIFMLIPDGFTAREGLSAMFGTGAYPDEKNFLTALIGNNPQDGTSVPVIQLTGKLDNFDLDTLDSLSDTMTTNALEFEFLEGGSLLRITNDNGSYNDIPLPSSLKRVAVGVFPDIFGGTGDLTLVGGQGVTYNLSSVTSSYTLPEDAKDGDVLHIQNPAKVLGLNLKTDDFVTLYDNKTKGIVTRLPTSASVSPPTLGRFRGFKEDTSQVVSPVENDWCLIYRFEEETETDTYEMFAFGKTPSNVLSGVPLDDIGSDWYPVLPRLTTDSVPEGYLNKYLTQESFNQFAASAPKTVAPAYGTYQLIKDIAFPDLPADTALILQAASPTGIKIATLFSPQGVSSDCRLRVWATFGSSNYSEEIVISDFNAEKLVVIEDNYNFTAIAIGTPANANTKSLYVITRPNNLLATGYETLDANGEVVALRSISPIGQALVTNQPFVVGSSEHLFVFDKIESMNQVLYFHRQGDAFVDGVYQGFISDICPLSPKSYQRFGLILTNANTSSQTSGVPMLVEYLYQPQGSPEGTPALLEVGKYTAFNLSLGVQGSGSTTYARPVVGGGVFISRENQQQLKETYFYNIINGVVEKEKVSNVRDLNWDSIVLGQADLLFRDVSYNRSFGELRIQHHDNDTEIFTLNTNISGHNDMRLLDNSLKEVININCRVKESRISIFLKGKVYNLVKNLLDVPL